MGTTGDTKGDAVAVPGAAARASRRRWMQQMVGGAASVALPMMGRAAQPTLHIGLSLPLSAPTTSDAASATNIVPDLGLDYLAGFSAAIELERHGMNIEAVALDDVYRPETARANIETLEKQGVVAISGIWSTEAARAALPTVERAGLPVVGLRSGAPDLRTGKYGMLFHLRPGYDDEVQSLVNVMGGAGFTQFGVLHADDEYGKICLGLLRAASKARVVKAQTAGTTAAEAAQSAREIVSTPGVQALVVLAPVEVLAPVMTELRIRRSPFLAPVSGLSHVLCNKLAVARDPVYRAFAVTCPYPNPLYSRADIATRFRDAMAALGLDHAERSYSAFEGFVAGTLTTRALVSVRATPTREALARALRARPYNLGGLRVEFDDKQIGYRHVNFLYKSQVDGNFRA
jgi:branched-chain amino acid transport system substrate-binding protein